MDITSTDLRYHTKDVFAALKRNETVRIFRRGELMGEIKPKSQTKNEVKKSLQDHPSFGSIQDDRPIEEIMRELRKPREFNDII
jgi:antitoxin (DNA-binding transcriptional repressor) of toxin-antitoxin stability system